MSVSLRDLNRRMDALATPQIDVADLMRQGEARLRRRRATAAVAATVAVVVTIAGAAALTRGNDQSMPAPTGPSRPINKPPPAKPPARQILYSEVRHIQSPPYRVDGAFHFGDRVIATDNWNVHMDVTDDGFVHTTDDARLYFSDGARPRQIGSEVCGRSWNFEPMWIGAYEQDSVMAGNAGSLVAWFDCTPGARGILVVYDTSVGREVVHQQMAACMRNLGSTPSCSLTAVVGEHVYFTQSKSRVGGVGRMVMLDVTNRRERPVTPQAYADDLRGRPRELVVGGSPQTGTLTDGIGQIFGVTGSRLIPMIDSSDPSVTTSAFDAATGRALGFHLPSGYRSDGPFTLFEWLDDDTVALAGVDILTCRLSDGRCELAVKGVHGRERLLPQTILVG